jgi:hypothetical protein
MFIPILCEEKSLEIDGEQIIYSRTNYHQGLTYIYMGVRERKN